MQQSRHASLRRAEPDPVAAEALLSVLPGLAGEGTALQLCNLAAARTTFCALTCCQQGFSRGAAGAATEPAAREQTFADLQPRSAPGLTELDAEAGTKTHSMPARSQGPSRVRQAGQNINYCRLAVSSGIYISKSFVIPRSTMVKLEVE